MLRLDFWPENRASRLARTWATFTIFLKITQKKFFLQNFCFFRRFRPKFTPPSPLCISDEPSVYTHHINLGTRDFSRFTV